jgi:Na+/melibiose symporter-like transporter
LITSLLYYVTFSLYSLNYSALLLSKFRNPKERLIISTIIEFFSIIFLSISTFILPIFIVSFNSLSYILPAIIISVVFWIALVVGIPGLLEERELIDTYYSPNLHPQEWFLKDFFMRFTIFRRKNFIILLIQWLGLAAFNYFFFNGLFYYAEYVIGVSSVFVTILSGVYFMMTFIAIPFGFLISWFAGYVKTWIISGFLLGSTTLIFFFLNDAFSSILLMAAVGFAFGLGTVALIPLTGDIFDEHALHERKRSEGCNYGILAFFGSGITIILPFVIVIVHSMTGFDPITPMQSELAIMGIRILFSLIPGIAIIISIVLFLVLYDLKPGKVTEIQEGLKTLQI